VDLGCGRGVECFLAARAVGVNGRVIGVDMLDSMLGIARSGAAQVAGNLGYENMEFRKGYLEALPLETGSVDPVISNCVLNLTADKRRTFAEIRRVLRPGGRVVVSDVVTEHVPDAAILNDDGPRCVRPLNYPRLCSLFRCVRTSILTANNFPETRNAWEKRAL